MPLCLDAGHVTYDDGDNPDLIRRASDRAGQMRANQLGKAAFRQTRQRRLAFGSAVSRRLHVELLAGAALDLSQ